MNAAFPSIELALSTPAGERIAVGGGRKIPAENPPDLRSAESLAVPLTFSSVPLDHWLLPLRRARTPSLFDEVRRVVVAR